MTENARDRFQNLVVNIHQYGDRAAGKAWNDHRYADGNALAPVHQRFFQFLFVHNLFPFGYLLV